MIRKGYIVFFNCKEGFIQLKKRSFYLKHGMYAYVGSCGLNCAKRISRHLSKEKGIKHWHVDFLANLCEPTTALILNFEEKKIARIMAAMFYSIEGFGNTDDLEVPSHLFSASASDVISLLREKQLL
ncbi:DUF123 domain-containing protein [Acidianus sp. RZ1]|uniref:DUF123 domain-containing protein n=1 Tax=Acidianus sp. RZ1 TaxID=1540082 RepID=UPI001490ADA0|nr:DUF123 domain-containing protein [Acidianus sp. RZ1]NON62145.1 DUF123 domain-containing protein [Acidianus sp. RZ1]